MLEDCCFQYSSIVKENWGDTTYVLYQPELLNYYKERINIEIKSETFELKDYKFEVYTVLKLSCKTEISINNCVFEEGFGIFIGTDDSIEDIAISVFRTESKKIIIGPHKKYNKISIDSCLIDDLSFRGELIDVIDIYKCEILDLYFESSIINKIKITGSFVKLLKYHFATFEDVYIDRSSVTAHHNGRLNVPLKLFVQKMIQKTISEIETLDKYLKNPVPPDNISKREYIRNLKFNKKICKKYLKEYSVYSKEYYLKYLLLLLKSTHVSFDSNALSELKYLYFKNLQNNFYIKFILWFICYLHKPNRIILSSIATIILFSILFFLVSSDVQNLIRTDAFLTKSSLPIIFDNLENSFYFSGITFFTIGYGDELCVPDSFQWVKNILIFLEAGIGVSFFASFVLSLSNKYLIFLKHDS